MAQIGYAKTNDKNIKLLEMQQRLDRGILIESVEFDDTGLATVTHALGRIPRSWHMEAPDRAGSVWIGWDETTTTELYLQTDNPGMVCNIRIF